MVTRVVLFHIDDQGSAVKSLVSANNFGFPVLCGVTIIHYDTSILEDFVKCLCCLKIQQIFFTTKSCSTSSPRIVKWKVTWSHLGLIRDNTSFRLGKNSYLHVVS